MNDNTCVRSAPAGRDVMVGKIVRIAGEKCFTVSMVTDWLGDGYLLARYYRVHPDRSYEPLPQSHVVSLAQLAVPDGVDVFDGWEQYLGYEFDGPDAVDVAPPPRQLAH